MLLLQPPLLLVLTSVTGMDAAILLRSCNLYSHSATVVGDSLVIFGGWDQPEVFNDVYVLDLATMEFERLAMSGKAPSPRR